MRRFFKLFAIAALVTCAAGPGILRVTAQARATVADLLNQLQSSQTSGHAETQLLKLGNSDAEARKYLSQRLPVLIQADPRDSHPKRGSVLRLEWYNAVQVAGKLKIVEAAPALAKWISFPPSPPTTSEDPVPDKPAARALVEIGDPAIPVLQSVLAHGNGDERWQAAEVLDLIGSSKANIALSRYVATGKDRELAEFIKKTMSR